jgi:hypothetical protein
MAASSKLLFPQHRPEHTYDEEHPIQLAKNSPVDNCLISRGVTVLEQAHGPDVGSDHLPLIIRFWAVRGRPSAVMISLWYRGDMKASRNDTRVSFPLRLPVDLRAKLEGAARESYRSLNAEIVFRLERSIREGEDGQAAGGFSRSPTRATQ